MKKSGHLTNPSGKNGKECCQIAINRHKHNFAGTAANIITECWRQIVFFLETGGNKKTSYKKNGLLMSL
jgi:hypothetical protein